MTGEITTKFAKKKTTEGVVEKYWKDQGEDRMGQMQLIS